MELAMYTYNPMVISFVGNLHVLDDLQIGKQKPVNTDLFIPMAIFMGKFSELDPRQYIPDFCM